MRRVALGAVMRGSSGRYAARRCTAPRHRASRRRAARRLRCRASASALPRVRVCAEPCTVSTSRFWTLYVSECEVLRDGTPKGGARRVWLSERDRSKQNAYRLRDRRGVVRRIPQHARHQYASSSIMATGGSARASSPGRPFTAAPTFRRAAWPPALMPLPLPVTTFGGAVSPLGDSR